MRSEVGALLVGYLAAFVALLLLASAAHKFSSASRMDQSARDLLQIPASWARAAWLLAGGVEITAAIAIFGASTRVFGALAAGALWSLYALALVRALISRRDDVDCGCSFGIARSHSPAASLGRTSILAVAAVALAAAVPPLGAVTLGIPEILGGLAFLTLHIAHEAATTVVTRAARS